MLPALLDCISSGDKGTMAKVLYATKSIRQIQTDTVTVTVGLVVL